jgi:hypothetical protein
MSRENMGRDFEGGTTSASASDRVEVIVKPRHVDVVADEIEEEV